MKIFCMFSSIVLLLSKCGIGPVFGVVQHALTHTASATDVLFSLLETLSVELSQRLSIVIWSIWKPRNLKIWDDVIETVMWL